MSDPHHNALDDITVRLKNAIASTDGEMDVESIASRVRASIGQTASEVDTEAIVNRVKGVVSQVEGSVDTQQLREWIGSIDKDTVKGWVDDPKGAAATAAAFVSAQGERISDRAPGALDKVIGVVKETIGDVTGKEDLSRQGELQQLKGDIEGRLAGAAEAVEGEIERAKDGASNRTGNSGG